MSEFATEVSKQRLLRLCALERSLESGTQDVQELVGILLNENINRLAGVILVGITEGLGVVEHLLTALKVSEKPL